MTYYRFEIRTTLEGGQPVPTIVEVPDDSGTHVRRADHEALLGQLDKIQVDATTPAPRSKQ